MKEHTPLKKSYMRVWRIHVCSLNMYGQRRCFPVVVLQTSQSDPAAAAAAATAAAAAEAAGRMALIDYHLGVIALAVEENSAAQEALDKCAVSQPVCIHSRGKNVAAWG